MSEMDFYVVCCNLIHKEMQDNVWKKKSKIIFVAIQALQKLSQTTQI